eukprot:1174893-Rhodomonas_salina.2
MSAGKAGWGVQNSHAAPVSAGRISERLCQTTVPFFTSRQSDPRDVQGCSVLLLNLRKTPEYAERHKEPHAPQYPSVLVDFVAVGFVRRNEHLGPEVFPKERECGA